MVNVHVKDPINEAVKSGKYVLVREEYLRSLEETLYLKSIPGMEEKLLQAIDEVGVEIDWRKKLK